MVVFHGATFELKQDTIFTNKEVLAALATEYTQGRWADRGISFPQFIDLTREANRIQEDKERAQDKESGFLQTISEGIFGVNEYSNASAENSELAKGLLLMDLELRAGVAGAAPPKDLFMFGSTYRDSLTAIWKTSVPLVAQLRISEESKQGFQSEYQQVIKSKSLRKSKTSTSRQKTTQKNYSSL